MTSHPRVLIADSDAPTRMGLRVALVEAGFEIGAEAITADKAVEAALTGELDLGLLDVELPEREWEVLEMLADDASTAEMANGLHISEVTVRRHVSSLVAKLGVADRSGAARLLRPSAPR